MKKIYFNVYCNTEHNQYQVKACDPAYRMYDALFTSIGDLMGYITILSKIIRQKYKARGVFNYE